MSNLYIFAIGGTGSRVLKSLTMMLASGVKIKATSIVPIIIDADKAAGNLTEVRDLIGDYVDICAQMKTDKDLGFFGTRIDTSMIPSMMLTLSQTNNKTFGQYIDYPNMTLQNKAFTSLMFSEKNLGSSMDVGFKGNPNVGSVVLNQFQNSNAFQQVLKNFQTGDRIFIIASIFGGTGASGMPLLLKTLRTLNGQNNVQQAPIGIITVMPYFKIADNKKSAIDSNTFITRTKAALSYYENHIEADDIYYIADNPSNNPYANCMGGREQKNPAHFVELASALSMIHFMNIPDASFNYGKPNFSSRYYEYGIKNEVGQITFPDLEAWSNKVLDLPLSKFLLFAKYLKEHLEEGKKQDWSNCHSKNNVKFKFDDQFFQSPFYGKITRFTDELFCWYKELADNRISFAPFDLEENKKKLFHFIKGFTPQHESFPPNNYAKFDVVLNKTRDKLADNNTSQYNFIKLFNDATEELIKYKFANIK